MSVVCLTGLEKNTPKNGGFSNGKFAPAVYCGLIKQQLKRGTGFQSDLSLILFCQLLSEPARCRSAGFGPAAFARAAVRHCELTAASAVPAAIIRSADET